MDGKTFGRIVAVIFVATAVTAAAVGLTRKEEEPAGAAPQTLTTPAPNPLRDGLRNCQALGEAALRNGDCLRLWAEQRDRFLRSGAPSTPSASQPATSQSPDATTQGAR